MIRTLIAETVRAQYGELRVFPVMSCREYQRSGGKVLHWRRASQ